MKKLIYILTLIVCFSCSKEKDYHTIVKGTVSNAENNDYIEGYSMVIREQIAELFSWSSTLEVIRTDNKGRFEFSFEARKNYIYSIVSVDNTYFEELVYTSIVVGKTNEFNFKVNPVTINSNK